MKKRLKQNVTSSEYFRLPQMYIEATFQEMQKSVSEKYVQYVAGLFPESEHQKPYESDGDYQQVENAYVPWEYPPYSFDPWEPSPWVPSPYKPNPYPHYPGPEPPANPKDIAAKDIAAKKKADEDIPDDKKSDIPTPLCKAAWARYLEEIKGLYLDARQHSIAIYNLVKSGCTRYVPFLCCPNVWEVKEGEALNKRKRASGESSIIGPSEVEPGQTVQYDYIHAQPGCSYTWDAKLGRVVSGTYTAPTGSDGKTDSISVTPFMSDDNAVPCATMRNSHPIAHDPSDAG
jgi:hypothetical protein